MGCCALSETPAAISSSRFSGSSLICIKRHSFFSSHSVVNCWFHVSDSRCVLKMLKSIFSLTLVNRLEAIVRNVGESVWRRPFRYLRQFILGSVFGTIRSLNQPSTSITLFIPYYTFIYLPLLCITTLLLKLKNGERESWITKKSANRRFFIQPLFVAPNYHQRLVVHSKWNEWLCTDSRPENQTYTCVLIKANPLLEQNPARQQQRCRHWWLRALLV